MLGGSRASNTATHVGMDGAAERADEHVVCDKK